MEVENLMQTVKELRRKNGLSQEELAKKSGLSLRTVQRVENGETKSTGETLKRIANAFGITAEELLSQADEKDTFKKTIKLRYGYLHIFESKLIFSKSEDFDTAVNDYEKSINNLFKTLTVFFVAVPIFAIIAVILYSTHFYLSFYAGSMAIFFMLIGIYLMLFTSGKPIIYRRQIKSVKLQRLLFQDIVVIKHYDLGRIKRMSLIIPKDEIETVKEVFVSENLCHKTDFSSGKKKERLNFIVKFIIYFLIIYLPIFSQFPSAQERFWFHGFTLIAINSPILFLIISGFVESHKWKKKLK